MGHCGRCYSKTYSLTGNSSQGRNVGICSLWYGKKLPGRRRFGSFFWRPQEGTAAVGTCFFEIGCASIIGNATGGIRGCIIGAALSGIIMVFLVGFGSYFFGNTINNWMLVYGGQDFSL